MFICVSTAAVDEGKIPYCRVVLPECLEGTKETVATSLREPGLVDQAAMAVFGRDLSGSLQGSEEVFVS